MIVGGGKTIVAPKQPDCGCRGRSLLRSLSSGNKESCGCLKFASQSSQENDTTVPSCRTAAKHRLRCRHYEFRQSGTERDKLKIFKGAVEE